MPYPGPKSKPLTEEMARLGVMSTRPFVINLEKSKGMFLRTLDGQDIFDWAGYYGARLLGHNHSAYSNRKYKKRILIAAQNKIDNPDFVTQDLLDYYRFLHAVRPACMPVSTLKTYTVNSGAEAVENALKYCVARYYKKNAEASTYVDAPRFICFQGGFHGRTVYALSHTDMPYDDSATRNFRGLSVTPFRLPFPEHTDLSVQASLDFLRSVLDYHGGRIAGLLIEPMQSAGGNRTAPKSWWQALSAILHEYDIPLILDEVQTAGGQAGTVWMCDQLSLPYTPTCVVSAKKFGCGVVYMDGAMDEEVLDSTWSGSLVDMVRVPYEFSVVRKEKLIEQVPAKAGALVEALETLQVRFPALVGDVQGIGLYQGFVMPNVEIREQFLRKALQAEHTLLLGAGENAVRLRPNLNVTLNDIDHLVHRLYRVLSSF